MKENKNKFIRTNILKYPLFHKLLSILFEQHTFEGLKIAGRETRQRQTIKSQKATCHYMREKHT